MTLIDTTLASRSYKVTATELGLIQSFILHDKLRLERNVDIVTTAKMTINHFVATQRKNETGGWLSFEIENDRQNCAREYR